MHAAEFAAEQTVGRKPLLARVLRQRRRSSPSKLVCLARLGRDRLNDEEASSFVV